MSVACMILLTKFYAVYMLKTPQVMTFEIVLWAFVRIKLRSVIIYWRELQIRSNIMGSDEWTNVVNYKYIYICTVQSILWRTVFVSTLHCGTPEYRLPVTLLCRKLLLHSWKVLYCHAVSRYWCVCDNHWLCKIPKSTLFLPAPSSLNFLLPHPYVCSHLVSSSINP